MMRSRSDDAPASERESHERITVSTVPVSHTTVKSAERVSASAEALDVLLVATCELPVQEGEHAVAEAIVKALAQVLPQCGVGVCLVAQADRSRSQSQIAEQSVFKYTPVGREGGAHPTRLFSSFTQEHVVDVDATGTTLHIASDDDAVLQAGSTFDFLTRRARLALERGLHFARVHQKSTVDAEELRALNNHMVQAEKLASLGQLAAGVVHELNNPLTSIVAYTDYLSKRAEARADKDDLERLRRVSESANRMLRFTRDLVTYARPSREEPVPFTITTVIDQALAFCEHVVDQVGVSVQRAYAATNAEVRGMPEQLAQVFVNLVTNACHAMPEAGGKLVLRTAFEGDSQVRVQVEDNGHGILDQHLSQIFVPFFTTKGEGRGTGLGLSIVRNIVDNHRGQIWAERIDGGGTRFVITLPLREP
jgi:two-component system NtrC family sensor kinase